MNQIIKTSLSFIWQILRKVAPKVFSFGAGIIGLASSKLGANFLGLALTSTPAMIGAFLAIASLFIFGVVLPTLDFVFAAFGLALRKTRSWAKIGLSLMAIAIPLLAIEFLRKKEKVPQVSELEVTKAAQEIEPANVPASFKEAAVGKDALTKLPTFLEAATGVVCVVGVAAVATIFIPVEVAVGLPIAGCAALMYLS